MLDSLDTIATNAHDKLSSAISRLSPEQSGWLRQTAEQIERTRWAAEVYDAEWNLMWISEELSQFLGSPAPQDVGLGKHILEAYRMPAWRGKVTRESFESSLRTGLAFIAHDTPGGIEAIESLLDPSLSHLLDHLEEASPPPVWNDDFELRAQPGLAPVRIHCLSVRIYDGDHRLVGTARIYGPGLRASLLSLVAGGDEDMYERISRLVNPGRQPVAVMFADLESSTQLSRRLPSKVYFKLIAELTNSIDRVILNHNGVVGKHSGDGVSAFFIANEHGAISSAVRASIAVAREIQEMAPRVACDVLSEAGVEGYPDICFNIGLHWGATVYIGQIATSGRVEVTALGDEVNDCARIEACASGGQILASKPLIERLSSQDAEHLQIDTASRIYDVLNDIGPEDGKAGRDSVSVPVTALVERDHQSTD